jgi:hypothetical protein
MTPTSPVLVLSLQVSNPTTTKRKVPAPNYTPVQGHRGLEVQLTSTLDGAV